jgi:hypothetical protein
MEQSITRRKGPAPGLQSNDESLYQHGGHRGEQCDPTIPRPAYQDCPQTGAEQGWLQQWRHHPDSQLETDVAMRAWQFRAGHLMAAQCPKGTVKLTVETLVPPNLLPSICAKRVGNTRPRPGSRLVERITALLEHQLREP